jgi:hypothetical protein
MAMSDATRFVGVMIVLAGCQGVMVDAAPAYGPEAAADLVDGGGTTGGPSLVDGGAIVDASLKPGDSREVGRDAPVFVSRCDDPNLLFCETFESGGLDAKVWRWIHETATSEVQTARVWKGKHALRLNTSNLNARPWNFSRIQTTRAYPIAGQSLFARIYIYLDTRVPNRHFTVIEATSTQPPIGGGGWAYYLNIVPAASLIKPQPLHWRALWAYQSGLKEQYDPRSLVPVGKWSCWEWEMRGSQSELYLWVDGQPVPGMTVLPSAKAVWAAPKLAHLSFGFRTSHTDSLPAGGYDVWLDNIAVDDQRIGCEPPGP